MHTGRWVALAAMGAMVMAGFTTGAPASARPRTVLPVGYRAQSLSWASPSQGWILGVM